MNSKKFSKLVFLVFGGAISLGLLVVGGYQLLNFTESTAFCGRLCHNVMNAEYTAYQNSPHSRVECVSCHVGSGASYFVKSKISGIPMIFATVTNNFEHPIPTPVHSLRPARDTCEQCHRPERFVGDIIQVTTSYKPDEANTKSVDTRVMRVGGGSAGIASGIHWHIQSNVYYISMDAKRQVIGWVGVEQPDGSLKEFINPQYASQITPALIATDKRLMDCIDCHNRATHVFQSPSDLIDNSISEGKIDPGIPYIKKELLSVLDPVNKNLNDAYTRLDGIRNYYITNYPDVYSTKKSDIDAAINEGKNIARLTTFPDTGTTWQTYPDNIGHIQAPGCFRCHGTLVAKSGPQAGVLIDFSCTLCHYQLDTPGQP